MDLGAKWAIKHGGEMSYQNWISEIYSVEDGIFKHWEAEDNIAWLEKIIRDMGGSDRLYDEDGLYKFKPKDEYEGFKRDNLTENNKFTAS